MTGFCKKCGQVRNLDAVRGPVPKWACRICGAPIVTGKRDPPKGAGRVKD